jgi:sigma-B regulation protein RsbU (phosphoserine phosphatase)
MDANPVLLTADQVLRVFHQDEPFLFLGAAFATVGMISMALAFLGRPGTQFSRFDPLLLWLGLFAFLYGNRLWLQTGLLALMVPDSLFFRSLRDSSNYLVPIPAFFYFRSAGFIQRIGSAMVYPLTAIMLALFAAVFLVGPRREFLVVNNVIVVAALLPVAIRFLRERAPNREVRVTRLGLLAFVTLALWDNLAGLYRRGPRLEPYGFLLFLAALGYVAVYRNLKRDTELAAVQKELEVAQEIQRSILPGDFPASAHFRVAARYAPMRTVAGDFYDFLLPGDGEAGLLIADVSGHGVPAALIASMVKLAAASQRAHAADPAALLAGMNRALCGNTQSQFVTAAYVHLDAATAVMRYAAAAHPPMLLLRDGDATRIVENGLMLGAFEAAEYQTAEHPLQPGDRLLLYTDGLLEAANERREEFGMERLTALLQQTRTLAQEPAADLILTTVQRWSATQDDDLTLLVCDYQRSA